MSTPKKKPAKVTKHAAEPNKDEPAGAVWKKGESKISINMLVASPANPWLPVTSKKTGAKVYLPLPIRLIQELPSENGSPAGCLVRGAHGDESTTKESVLEIFALLNAYSLGPVTEWRLAE